MLVALLLSATGCNNTESVPPQNDITAEESTTDVMSDVPESTTALAPVESEMAESTSVPSSMELKKVGNMQYYLYIPSNPEPGMTLIVYLHGGTNKKGDVGELLTLEGFPKFLYEGYYGDLRAYVAVPKLDESISGWANASDTVRNMIKSISDNYGIDMKKVALTGHSLGGTGTYQLQLKMSNTFACIAPMSGSVKLTDANIDALMKTKIWAFVGSEDKIVDPASSIETVDALKNINVEANITILDGATHFDVPSLAYKNEELIAWLVNCGELSKN